MFQTNKQMIYVCFKVVYIHKIFGWYNYIWVNSIVHQPELLGHLGMISLYRSHFSQGSMCHIFDELPGPVVPNVPPAGQCVTIVSNLGEHFAVPVFAKYGLQDGKVNLI